jgi:hypothetical protein
MSANGFAVIGRRPLIGRSFDVDDERPGATPILMLTHHAWQDRYGKDPAIIGRVIRVDEVPESSLALCLRACDSQKISTSGCL